MKEKIEQALKYIPIATLLCYVSGVLVIKSFLLEQEIYEGNIINIRFVEAGLLYLVFVLFVIVLPLFYGTGNKYLITTISSLFAFYLLNSLVGNINPKSSFISLGLVFIIITISYLFKSSYEKMYKTGKLDFGEIILRVFVFFIISLLLFGSYFREIGSNFGGGKPYKKVLVLKEKKDYLLKTDSLFKTDTLNILYENDVYFYFKAGNITKCVKKDLIDGEIMIK